MPGVPTQEVITFAELMNDFATRAPRDVRRRCQRRHRDQREDCQPKGIKRWHSRLGAHHTACIDILNRTAEMAFAGHPTIGRILAKGGIDIAQY